MRFTSFISPIPSPKHHFIQSNTSFTFSCTFLKHKFCSNCHVISWPFSGWEGGTVLNWKDTELMWQGQQRGRKEHTINYRREVKCLICQLNVLLINTPTAVIRYALMISNLCRGPSNVLCKSLVSHCWTEDNPPGQCDMHLAALAVGLALSFVQRVHNRVVVNINIISVILP